MSQQDIFNIQTDAASITHKGLVRKENEDNMGYAHTPNGHVFVVCDGMGGHVGGKEASQTAVNAILEFMKAKPYVNIPKAIAEAIKYANKKVYEKAQQNPSLKGMGTTVVMAVVKDDKIYIGHVGDSRIYLFTDGKLVQLTKDHSFVQKLYDMGIINEEEKRKHPRKNEITRALGLNATVTPAVPAEPLLLKNNDILLLCSDGLTDMVEDQHIARILGENPDVKQAAQKLIKAALEGGGKDNVTLQLIKITNSNYKESIYPGKTKTSIHEDITLIDENNTHALKHLHTPARKNRLAGSQKILWLGGLLLFSLLGVTAIWKISHRPAPPVSVQEPPKMEEDEAVRTNSLPASQEKKIRTKTEKARAITKPETNPKQAAASAADSVVPSGQSAPNKTTPPLPKNIKPSKNEANRNP